jgi:hypothetical protein
MLEDHVLVLFALSEIMYSYGCPIDANAMGRTTNSLTNNKVPQCYPFHEVP